MSDEWFREGATVLDNRERSRVGTVGSCKNHEEIWIHWGDGDTHWACREYWVSITAPTSLEATTKDTNPKDAVGCKKPPMSTVSAAVMLEVGAGMLEGACKYGRHNYREAGVRSSVYYDAAMRHMMSWWEGEDIDADSGINHISKAIACLTVLRDAQMNDMVNDDRPPKMKEGWLDRIQTKVDDILERYPDPKPPHTAL